MISSFRLCVHGSQPDAVQPAFTLTIPMRIIVRRVGHRPDFTLLLRQLFAWMKRRSRNGLKNVNLLYALTLTKGRNPFLGALTPPRTVTSCTASDIVNFLIFKDKSKRTVVHSSLCSRASCTCPKRLAAGSVDSLIGRLRAVFNNLDALMVLTRLPTPQLRTT